MNLLFRTASALSWAFLASNGVENWTRAPSGSPPYHTCKREEQREREIKKEQEMFLKIHKLDA